MALSYFSLTPRTVTTAPTAAGKVRYLLREGEYAPKAVAYLTREGPSSQDRTDLQHVEAGNLPAWAEGKATTFFAAAETYDTYKHGVWAYAIQFALPRELTHTQHLALARDFVQATMPNHPYVWVKHEPLADDGLPQPHIHLLVSPCLVDGIDRSPAQSFMRWNAKQPERGGLRKDRWWHERGALTQLRYGYADIANFHLERAHVAARIDPRNLKDRGIDRAAHGKNTRGKNLDRNATKEQAQAVAAWEQRKAYKQLGAVQDIPREEFVLLVRQWTRDYERGTALPRVSQEQWLEWAERDRTQTQREVTRLERQRDRAHAAVMIAEHRQRQPQRTRGVTQQLTRGDDMQQGLQGPDLEHKRRRDREGYEYD